MATTVACCISIIIGILICGLVNTKFSTDENVGRFIGIMVAVLLIAFFLSDKGQIFLRRLIEVFPVKL